MNFRSPFFVLTVLASTVALAQSTGANSQAGNNGTSAASNSAAVLNEETQLMQQFVAKRDAMNEARAAAFAKTKTAKTANEKKSANDEVRKIQSDFLKDNADLIGKLKAIEDQKKPQKPGQSS